MKNFGWKGSREVPERSKEGGEKTTFSIKLFQTIFVVEFCSGGEGDPEENL